MRVALSVDGPGPFTWRSFAPPTSWHHNFAGGVDVPGVGDFTGDRRDDTVAFGRGNGADVFVAQASTSNQFVLPRRWHALFAIGSEVPMPASMW